MLKSKTGMNSLKEQKIGMEKEKLDPSRVILLCPPVVTNHGGVFHRETSERGGCRAWEVFPRREEALYTNAKERNRKLQ
jgi:hypothetical protein